MKVNATFMCFGLLAVAMGCGNTPQDDSPAQQPPEVQASPARDMPSAQELAATATSAPVMAVPVQYVVDPSTTTRLSVSAGAERANPSASSASQAPGAMRRVLR
ncbi:hypothetical protein [Pyxidicoccus sp. MSG2]|uniref:hypothetical protein n=1 Tax=Pyxidicoccus sp. MSG2 TaxID=2996790 RepID=UPI00226F1439|nr:hypothetical protein [Pyxidicoccus sp. MSG2]MCY1017707.1 hypothetical protein [Pyxidicoccus sp. MSG2]